MNKRRNYHSKLLLFGEYSLMEGSQALGMSYRPFKARLSAGGTTKQTQSQDPWSNHILKQYYQNYLGTQPELQTRLDLQRLGRDIENGLSLESDIPVQSGLGSSGALCAAVYGNYAFNPLKPGEVQSKGNWRSLRNIFIEMESWFHGRSSGFDALISYLDQALLLEEDGEISEVSIPENENAAASVFLINTGLKAATGRLAGDFLNEFYGRNKNQGRETGDALKSLNNSCIRAFLMGDKQGFNLVMKELSEFQLKNMPGLVPLNVRKAWARGLKSNSFKLKICGSGGGGYILGFSEDPPAACALLREEGLETFSVEPKHQYHDNNVD